MASRIVDPDVAVQINGRTAYVLDRDVYHEDLRGARFVITTKRAGWDCMRRFEIAADGRVPCFRDLDRKPSTCAPHGPDGGNCVISSTADELPERIRATSFLESRGQPLPG